MTVAINIRALKGIGKSCFIEFLYKNVLGEHVYYQTSDSNILSGRFNGPLGDGKLIFVLEEAPCATQGDWKVFAARSGPMLETGRMILLYAAFLVYFWRRRDRAI